MLISGFGFAEVVRGSAPEFKELIEELVQFKCNA
jgi:hypothetical protein